MPRRRRWSQLTVALGVVLAAATGFLAVSGGARADDARATQPAGGDWSKHLAARADGIARKVARLRGLKMKRPIAKGVMSHDDLRKRIVASRDEDQAPAERAAEAAALKRWGLVPMATDLDALMLDLMTEQIAGFYDPREQKLYITVRPDFDQTWADMVMAHEIDHALQDQHFGLEKWMDEVEGDGDATAARQALVEGDGVVLMLEYTLAEQGQPAPWGNELLVRMLTANLEGGDDLLGQAPLLVRQSLVFPYQAGARFVAHLRRVHPWTRVDQAFKHPPRSTEQILHPELYLADERPDQITAGPPPATSGSRTIHHDVWGEAGWARFLETHGVGAATAGSAVAGWGGDRVALYGGASAAAFPAGTSAVAVTTWDTDLDAVEFWDALGAALDEMVVGTRLATATGHVRWLGSDGRITAAERRGRRVVIVTGASLTGWRELLAGGWQWPVVVAPGHDPL